MNTHANQPTMSSREIAELTGKRHDHVMRDIKNLLNALGEDAPKFGEMSRDSYGRQQPGYALPKRETLILVSGYDPVMRAKIIDRWMVLERQAAQTVPAIPQTFAEALRLAADQAEQIAAQAAQLEYQAPIVKVGERVVQHKHSLNQVVRTLPGVNSTGIKRDLCAAGYLYRQKGTNAYRVYRHYAKYFDECFSERAGFFDITPTPLGRALLVDLYNQGRLTMLKGRGVVTQSPRTLD